LGDRGWDGAFGVALAPDGSLFVAGETGSEDFPVREAHQSTYGGGSADAFVAKITPGGEIAWSTFLGGSARDYVWDATAMPNGDVVIVGSTHSPNFPTLNAFQNRPGGNAGGILDGFVSRFDGDGDLVFSTYVGGDDWDEAASVAAATDGTVWVAGWTSSSNFPQARAISTLGSPCRRQINQCPDAVLFGVLPDGKLAMSTYIGGSDDDRAQAVAVSTEGKVAVTGFTRSSTFPSEGAVVQPTIRRGPCQPSCGDAFLVLIDPAARTTSFATFLGGDQEDRGTAVSFASLGRIVVTGRTRSDDLGRLGIGGAYHAGCTDGEPPRPCFDAFVATLSPDGSAMTFGTYIGGANHDRPSDVAVNEEGHIALVGSTESSDFPLAQPIQARRSNASDAFVTVLQPPEVAPVFSTFYGGNDVDEAAGVAWGPHQAWVVGRSASNDLPLVHPLMPGPGGDFDAFVAEITFDDAEPTPGETPGPSATPTATASSSPTPGAGTTASPGSFKVWLPALHRSP
jgi:hypothetical protein